MSVGLTAPEQNKNGFPASESEYYGRDIGQENCQNQDQLIIIYIFYVSL